MKKLFILLSGIFAVICLVFFIVLFATSGMSDSAETFFSAIAENDMTTAESTLSEAFKKSVSGEQLKQFIQQVGLTDYESVSWSSRSMENNMGTLEGTVNTKDGGAFPIKVSTIKEKDGWKIYHIERQDSGLSGTDNSEKSSPDGSIPPLDKQKELIKLSNHIFALSVNAKNMNMFYRHISDLWKKQVTVEELNTAFKAFFDAGIDLTPLQNEDIVFDKGSLIDSNNILTTTSHCPLNNMTVSVEQKYVFENSEWKLISYSINVN